ncbi:MAG TPA: hypothetical protein VJ599_02200 [Nitrososphaeraceae archaeon]|nr:hypothetical protein [Nitrososphaeraceae archaeon]
MIFANKTSFKSLFLLAIVAISIISVAFFLYRYESVNVNFFPQNSDLTYRGVFSNATSLTELGNTSNSLGLSNMSNGKANTSVVAVTNNNSISTIDDLVSLSNPVDTLTTMIVNILKNSSIVDTQDGKDIELKNYYELGGKWNLSIRGDQFSNFTGQILLNNKLNNITKIYDIKLVTSADNNITYQASNQILKIKGTGDITFDGQNDKVQLLIILYKNENVYVVFASKTEENLFNSFLIDGNIVERKFEY